MHISKLVWLFCWVLILGFAVWQFLGWLEPTNQYQNYFGQNVEFEGVISKSPTQNNSQIITVLPDGYHQEMRASFYFPIVVQKRDRVWVRGRLEPPENFSDFNYVGYLQRHNTFAILKQPKVIRIKRAKLSFQSSLLNFQKQIITAAEQNLNKQSSSLVLGMLIGYRQSLPEQIETSFQRAGLTHILAVSGFNMTIIASTFGIFAWVIGRRNADWVAIIGIIIFTFLTGMTAAVVRAAIMAIIWLLARLLGRISYSYTALLLAITMMLIENPLILFYDVGFKLSVAATIGVLSAHKLITQLEKSGFLTQVIWPTLGAIIMTAPIVAFSFKTFSVIAPFSNAVVLPFIPIMMLFGFLALLPVISYLAVPIIEFLIDLEARFIAWVSAWNYSSVSILISWEAALVYYIIIFLIWRIFFNSTIKSSISLNKNEVNSQNFAFNSSLNLALKHVKINKIIM